jgi:hypothetical protein
MKRTIAPAILAAVFTVFFLGIVPGAEARRALAG